MPLIKGDAKDDPHRPAGRIRNTRKLLATAAIDISIYFAQLVAGCRDADSARTTLHEPGPAANRAAGVYRPRRIAHLDQSAWLFGEAFGTI